MKRKNLRIEAILTLLVIVTMIAACSPGEQGGQADVKPVQVELVPVARRTYKIPVRASGLLGTTTQMKLSFKTGGIIRQIQAEEGHSYEEGDILAVLDLSEIRATVNQARIGLERAGRDMERAENLYMDSVATLEQFQNAKSAFELARSQVEIAEFNLQHSKIYAPSRGKVQKVLVESSELITSGYPAILFASTENDWVLRASLTDKDIVRLSLGDSANILVDAFPEMQFPGEVSQLATVADPLSGTYEIEIRIHSSHPQFRTGFFSRVEILPSQFSNSMVIPVESLLDATDRTAEVFVFKDGKALKRRVKTAALLGGMVVVSEGLKEGEHVITEGAKYLREGMNVSVSKLKESTKP